MKPIFLAVLFLLVALPAAAQSNSAACVSGPASNRSAVCNVRDQGAVCDGTTHPLSGIYGSLGAAQASYPFITSLTQERDYAAIKETFNLAFGIDGSEHGNTHPEYNVPVYIPEGKCEIGANTLTVHNAVGIRIMGSSAFATWIEGSVGTVLQFQGLWYSEIGPLHLRATGTPASQCGSLSNASGTVNCWPVLDIDGDTSTGSNITSAQGNVFYHLFVDGGSTNSWAITHCLYYTSSGQCDTSTFINARMINVAESCYYQPGNNALSNQFIGGDCQNFSIGGFRLAGGSFHIFGTTFESTKSYGQIVNSGCDIVANESGTLAPSVIDGVRSEDLCFIKSTYAQPVTVHGLIHEPAVSAWVAATHYSLNDATIQTAVNGKHLYVVTTAGTSQTPGPPTWPTSGTLTDGSVVWTLTAYTAVSISTPGSLFDGLANGVDDSATVVTNVDFPAPTGCGGGAALSTDANVRRGKITIGSSPGTCEINFGSNGNSDKVEGDCVLSLTNGSATPAYTVARAGITITGTPSVSQVYSWVCNW